MKTVFHGLVALFLAVLLSGCNPLTQYTISEQEVNQALQKHNNFEKEGYAKNYLMINGQWQDHVLTALTSKEWTPNRRG